MTPKRLYTFAIDPDLDAGLKALKVRDGIGESETIRRALRQWLEKKGVITKARPAVRVNAPRAGKRRQQR